MSQYHYFVVVAVFASVVSSFAQGIPPAAEDTDEHHKFPSDVIRRCRFGDGECIRNLTQQLFAAHHQTGMPAIGLARLSPLDLGQVTINQGDGAGPVTVHITMSKVKLYGWERLEVLRVSGFDKNPRTSKFRIDVYAPVEHMVGRYKLTGKMLVLPITGQGAANVTIEKIFMNITLRTSVVERDGAEYLQIDGGRILVSMGRLHLQFENLLNDPSLSDGVNAMLNENQHLLINEMRGAISKSFERPLQRLIGPVFDRYPYREMFVDDGTDAEEDGGGAESNTQ